MSRHRDKCRGIDSRGERSEKEKRDSLHNQRMVLNKWVNYIHNGFGCTNIIFLCADPFGNLANRC